jgi:hypothetical protein
MTLATETEACREFARNIGEEFPERAWLLTSFDTWEPNPFYHGPKVPHPEADYDYDYETRAVTVAPPTSEEIPF